jgi:DNA mismatch repair protein PMS2
VGQSFQPQVQPLKQTLLATTSGTTSTTGIGNSHARNQSQNSEAKRKLSDVQEDLDTGEPHDPSVASDALTQDDNSSGDVRMGEPHLLIETPDVSHRRQDISGVDVPMVDDRPSIGAHDQPPITVGPTPSKASDVAALRQEAGYMEAEETEPRIETIQSSLESDSQISESLGPLRNSTPNTSIASLSSHTGHASQGGLSGSTGSSTRAPSVPYSRPEVNTRTSSRRSVQMVLSTAGASWNLRRGGGDVEPPRKKSRTSEPENATDTSGEGKGNKGRDARQNLRHRLSSFARAGSQIVNDEVEVVGLSGDDAAEVDELQEEDEDELTNLGRQRKKAGYNREGYGDMDLDVRPEEDIHNKSGLSTAIDADDVPPVIKSQAIKVESEVIDLTHDNGHDGSRDIAILEADRSVSDIQSQQFGEGIARPEIIRSADSESVSMRFDLSKVSDIWLQLRDKLLSTPSVSDLGAESMPSFERDAGVSNLEDDKKAIDALSRVIDKEDFGWMEIIGQFNLGFIVTRRRKAIDQEGRDMDDLFIVDQHAADEKYNFETLQQTTRIKSQKLFRSVYIQIDGGMRMLMKLRPQSLELTAADELLAIENIEILRQNGFEVGEVDDPNTGLGHRLQLVAQPVSKSTDFDMKGVTFLVCPVREKT